MNGVPDGDPSEETGSSEFMRVTGGDEALQFLSKPRSAIRENCDALNHRVFCSAGSVIWRFQKVNASRARPPEE
jgi:hypothetical protein